MTAIQQTSKRVHTCALLVALLAALLAAASSALAAVSAEASQTSPSPSKLDTLLDRAVREWDVTLRAADIDRAYPNLRPIAAKRGAALSKQADTAPPGATTEPTKEAFTLVAIVIGGQEHELRKYLNYWNRADSTQRTPEQHYPVGTFDKVTSDAPRRQAFAIYRSSLGGYTLLRFEQPEGSQPWVDTSMAELKAAVRLGAALSLIQDAMNAIHQGGRLDVMVTTPKVRWTGDKPVLWVVREQIWQDKQMGLYPLQVQLGQEKKTDFQLGLYLHISDSKDSGIELHVVSTEKPGYLGWRIAAMKEAKEPQTEAAK